jgi:hypothetical protein
MTWLNVSNLLLLVSVVWFIFSLFFDMCLLLSEYLYILLFQVGSCSIWVGQKANKAVARQYFLSS